MSPSILRIRCPTEYFYLTGFVIHELQADEIRTFVGAKKRVIWVLTTLEVWSRL